MPSALAFKVISLAKSASLPPMASATTTAASFADLVTSPLIASSTLMVWLALRPSFVGFCSAACIEIELAGLELLEQQVERHDLGQRRRVARFVRVDLVQHEARFVIDHDGRIRRMIVGAVNDARRGIFAWRTSLRLTPPGAGNHQGCQTGNSQPM